MVPSNREQIATAVKGPSARQTISNLLVANDTLRRGAAAWARVLSARQAAETIRVISGIRDPVARSISIIIFMSDFYGHLNEPLNPRVTMTPEYVIEYLRENWRLVLEGRAPNGSFEWLLWYLTGAYRIWFAEELGVAFGVDVLTGEFTPGEAPQRITTSAADILIYRVEDMQPAAPGHSVLLEQASAFLGASVHAIRAFNTSSTRRSREISEAVRRRFSLPLYMLEAIYHEAVVRHFYSPDEIRLFTARWRE
jgi:hypothetical protein